MPNKTMKRFGYPQATISEYDSWVVLLRKQQVTLGSLVLCSKSDHTSFASLPSSAFLEFGQVVNDVERSLSAAFAYDKINYLMLMMVDPNVHFHVIPRYSTERSFEDTTVADHGWPAGPMLDTYHELSSTEAAALQKHIAAVWTCDTDEPAR